MITVPHNTNCCGLVGQFEQDNSTTIQAGHESGRKGWKDTHISRVKCKKKFAKFVTGMDDS